MTCPLLTGAGRGQGVDWRGRGRGRLFEGRGSNCGRGMWSVGRVNTSAPSEEVSQVFKVGMFAHELEKWRQFKGLNLGEKQPQEHLHQLHRPTSRVITSKLPNLIICMPIRLGL
jgi:hypothetical protein